MHLSIHTTRKLPLRNIFFFLKKINGKLLLRKLEIVQQNWSKFFAYVFLELSLSNGESCKNIRLHLSCVVIPLVLPMRHYASGWFKSKSGKICVSDWIVQCGV